MGDREYILLMIILPIILYSLSLYWLGKWRYFLGFFGINLLILIGAVAFMLYFNEILTDTDPYGLALFVNIIFYLMTHIFIVFLFACFYKLNQKYKWVSRLD